MPSGRWQLPRARVSCHGIAAILLKILYQRIVVDRVNCTNPPGPRQTHCVTPADLCSAALARKEAFAAEVLAYLLRVDATGVTVDWEYQYGNDMDCFTELWRFVKSVIGPHGKSFAAWISTAGAYTASPGNDDTEWNYTAYLPWADELLDMGSYWTVGHGAVRRGQNRSMGAVPCASLPIHSAKPKGRTCGVEGGIVDMLAHGARPDQIVPAVWLSRCYSNGSMTLTGWTQAKLRRFLDFAHTKGVRSIAVWTDGAMSQIGPPVYMGNPNLTTCKWFLPELLRWHALATGAGIADAVSQPEVSKCVDGDGRARASCFGWSDTDSTFALQAALDSNASHLTIDYTGKPWVVTPLFIRRDNLAITLEPGVELLAKKDEFHGVLDMLLTARSVRNITISGPGARLRMRRSDYAVPPRGTCPECRPYNFSGWRMALALYNVSDVSVRGLTITESGGDAIYVDGTGPPHTQIKYGSRNVYIADCVLDRSYRNGMSVIGVTNLRVERTLFSRTGGCRPGAG